MGLFGKKKKNTTKSKPRQATVPGALAPLMNIRMWKLPQYKGIVKFHHDRRGNFYLYYPELMAGCVPGQKIVLEAFPGDCTLHSSYNGSEIDTKRDGVLAWCYMGNVVGITSYGMEVATNLIKQGYRVIADAEADGWFAPGMLDLSIWVGRGRDCYDVVGR